MLYMLKNIPTIQLNKSPNSSAVIGGIFQKRKKPNFKNNTKKKRLFMKLNKITLTKFKNTKKEFKSSMKILTNKRKRS